MRAKLEYFAEHKDEFDVLFLGSSRVLCGLAPAEFDAALEELGHEVRSFNLAVGGMEAFEADHVLQLVLDLEPARLRWVVIEAAGWNPLESEQLSAAPNLRKIAWHTPSETRNTVEAILVAEAPMSNKLVELGRHVGLFGLWLTNAGHGLPIVDHMRGLSRLQPRQNPLFGGDIPGLGGWHPMERDNYRRESWDRRLSNLASADARSRKSDLRHFPVRALRRQVELVRSRELGLVYMSLCIEESPDAHALHEGGILPALLSYTSPREHPDLYRYELRADVNHMNSEGAKALSRLMAQDFARLVEGRAGEGPDGH